MTVTAHIDDAIFKEVMAEKRIRSRIFHHVSRYLDSALAVGNLDCLVANMSLGTQEYTALENIIPKDEVEFAMAMQPVVLQMKNVVQFIVSRRGDTMESEIIRKIAPTFCVRFQKV